jgi:NAD(P)-dependent dehydrogenase (short-subunit alcohol dehydrogenase family)
MGADTALSLGQAGYDVALTARDQVELDRVAELITARGASALPLASDLTDRQSMRNFARAATERFGRCDVVCNIGIYKGPGWQELFMDTTEDQLAISYEADVIAPALLAKQAVPLMIEQGGGTFINMSSSSVVMNPPGTVKGSGWSFAYVAAKAGVDRLASILNVEMGSQGIRAFTVEPGFVAYGERLAVAIEKYPGMPVSPPESIGPAIVWLVREPDAERLLSKRVYLPGITHRHGLLAGWDGPGTLYPSRG